MAAAYRVWENFGTTRASLQPFISDILSPVIIAGTGAGAIQSELSSSGLQVYGVDQSVPMLRVARKKRRQQAVCALAQRLPFEDAAFNTAIITTGVLETDPVSPPALIFDEIDRVLSATGMLLVSTMSPSEKFVRAGREIGVVVGNTVHQRRHYEIWRTRNQKKDLSDLVAK
jgi:ubiquinone/menaquinone biosynthesis C-methylase UbiE